MYETLSLPDAVILCSKGAHLSSLRPSGGSLLVFQFDRLTEQDAGSILSSADAVLCRSFHRTWRDIRRRMDSIPVGDRR
jgi:hypothetical protein